MPTTEEKKKPTLITLQKTTKPLDFTGVERMYYEIVSVVDGKATCERRHTADSLIKMGYREVAEGETIEPEKKAVSFFGKGPDAKKSKKKTKKKKAKKKATKKKVVKVKKAKKVEKEETKAKSKRTK